MARGPNAVLPSNCLAPSNFASTDFHAGSHPLYGLAWVLPRRQRCRVVFEKYRASVRSILVGLGFE